MGVIAHGRLGSDPLFRALLSFPLSVFLFGTMLFV